MSPKRLKEEQKVELSERVIGGTLAVAVRQTNYPFHVSGSLTARMLSVGGIQIGSAARIRAPTELFLARDGRDVAVSHIR
jgi:hypothetical protein